MMRKLFSILLLLAWCAGAHAQSSPGFTGSAAGNHNPLTATSLNNAFIAKQDFGGDVSASYAHATGSSTTHSLADWLSYFARTDQTNSWSLNQTFLSQAEFDLGLVSHDNVQVGAGAGGITIQTNGQMTISGATSGFLSFGAPAAVSSGTKFILPSANGTAGQLLTTDASGNTSWLGIAGDASLASNGTLTVTKTNGSAFTAAATTPIGTSGAALPLLSGANTWSLNQTFLSQAEFDLGLVSHDNVQVGAGAGGITIQTNGQMTISGATSGFLSFGAPAAVSSGTKFILPTANGAAGQLLTTDASGNTSWLGIAGDASLASNGTLTVTKTNGSAFTAAATTPIGTSGAAVPLLSGANTWSNNQVFSAPATFNAGMTSTGVTVGDGTTTEQWIFTPYSKTALPTATAAAQDTLSTAASGGSTGAVYGLNRRTLTLTGAPNAYFWTSTNILNFSGTGGTGQHVAGVNQTNRYNYAAGGSAANPQLWASVSEFNDFTGQPSSATNAELSHEFDLRGHNVDDANNRQSLSVVVSPALDNGNFFEANTAIGMTATSGAYLKSFFGGGGPYTVAAADFRYMASYAKNTSSLSTPTYPTVTSAVSASTTIPVSNVMPFTSDIYRRDIDKGFSNNVYFSDGQSAVETAYAITGTGATPSGTITVSSPITLASGITIYNNSRTIWLFTGAQIALDTAGSTQLSSDGSMITATASGGFLSTGGVKLAVKTVGTLPTCNSGNAGLMLAVSDAASPTYNGSLTGGGSTEIPTFCNGSAWTAH